MTLLYWLCFLLERTFPVTDPRMEPMFEPMFEPDLDYFFFDEDTGQVHNI